MPHAQQHRGPHPDDHNLFNEKTRLILLKACDDATYLLDRGYSVDSVLDLVGQRYELRVRQRTALKRCMCTTSQAKLRLSRKVAPSSLHRVQLEIDGFNLIIGAEVGLSRGLLLRGRDSALRDLAGLRGSYHPVEETELALELCGKAFHALNVSGVRFYLDQPVSNSGRLKHLILEHAQAWKFETQVELANNPDRELFGKCNVVSSDALVLDNAKSWVNLLEYFVLFELQNAWVLDLSLGVPDGNRHY